MSMTLNDIVARVRAFDPERALGLRPPLPPVVLVMDRDEVALLRVKRRRREPPLVEAHHTRPLPEGAMPASIFQGVQPIGAELTERLRELFEQSGTKPGRVSLVLPDNLAKVSLLTLPERPASPRQLDELVRAKMRRSVPFRLEESRLSYEVLGGESRAVSVLVILVRRALVEQFEVALEAIGARVGLIDLTTTNLFNLCRERLDVAGQAGASALLNCARTYFSLAIVRDRRLVFFRCKSFSVEDHSTGPNGILGREIANSLAYYREKLGGDDVATVLVRTTSTPFEEIASRLRALGCATAEALDASGRVDHAAVRIDDDALQRLAPAIGALVGRG